MWEIKVDVLPPKWTDIACINGKQRSIVQFTLKKKKIYLCIRESEREQTHEHGVEE